MTLESKQKLKPWVNTILIGALSAAGTLLATQGLKVCSSTATGMANSAFLSTAAASAMRSNLEDQIKAGDNDTRNWAAAQFEVHQKQVVEAERRNVADHREIKDGLDRIYNWIMKVK